VTPGATRPTRRPTTATTSIGQKARSWPALSLTTRSPIILAAVLSHDQRIALDGAPAEAVDAEAKDLVAKRRDRVRAALLRRRA
jgi:hypothetical protein